MSTTKDELHLLVERLPPGKEELALKALRHMVECPPPESDEVESTSINELLGRHLRQIGQRLGLNVDQLPQKRLLFRRNGRRPS
jgi:hypothetical protein